MADTIRPYVGQNVLEVGAGIGNITKEFMPKKNYFASDINPLYLQILNNFTHNKPYLSVYYLNIEDVTEFRKNKKFFDTVICLNVMEHLDDDLGVLKNIANILEIDGRAIILVPRGEFL